MKYLIVNADDYGHTAGVSEGIRYAHLKGIVTSTSAMMNNRHIEEELVRLVELCPRIGMGVHLVLTYGQPVQPVGSLPVLMHLSPDGQHFFKDLAAVADQVDLGEVKAEWQAQIDKFISITGRPPDHLDGHHHIMCLNSNFYNIYLELAQQYGCAVRRPVDEKLAELGGNNACDARVIMPDRLDTRFYSDGVSEAMLDEMIIDISAGTTEWMCHPARVDAVIQHISDYNIRRADELDLLTQANLRQKIDRAGIRLISFGDLVAAAYQENLK
jgi:chitin disaccharide deacetylase